MAGNPRKLFWGTMVSIVVLMAGLSACGPKTVNTQVAVVAQYGEALMQSIGAAQNVVITAESTGVLPTDQARASIQRFVEAATYGEAAAKMMDEIITLNQGDPTRSQMIIRLIDLLNRINHTAIGALLPLKIEAVSKDVALLIGQIGTLINTINREVLR